MPTEAIKDRLSFDWDNVGARTESHMRKVQRAEGYFVPGHFEPITPGDMLSPEYRAAKHRYLRDSDQIGMLPLYKDAILAMRILRKHFVIGINTARLENQRHQLEGLFSAKGISEYISSLYLRPLDTDDPDATKVQTAKDAGMTYAVEDNGIIAGRLALEGCKVALIRRPWNRWVLNSLDLRVYSRLLDYALELEYYGSPEKLFAQHAKEIRNPRNPYRTLHKVHKVRIYLA